MFSLSSEEAEAIYLYVGGNDTIKNADGVIFSRVESPSSLISSQQYEAFFETWYEESNLIGNTLVISEPDVWQYNDAKGKLLAEGNFYAYAGECNVYHQALTLALNNNYRAGAKLGV